MNNFFLLPTLRKIGVAVVSFVLFMPFITYDTGIRCIHAPCPSTNMGSIASYLCSHRLRIYAISYKYLILELIASYLISCGLIYLYEKSR